MTTNEEVKKVLRGYCIDTANSTNLTENKLYYLEPHGKGHYYCSNFPNAKESFMGIYRRILFEIVTDEQVILQNSSKEGEILKKDSLLEETATKENSTSLVEENVMKEGSVTHMDELETTQPLNEMLSDHVGLQESTELLTENHYILEQDKIYKAIFKYREFSYVKALLGEVVYLKAIPKDDPMCNDMNCIVYGREDCKDYKGVWFVNWFEIIEEIEKKEATLQAFPEVFKVLPTDESTLESEVAQKAVTDVIRPVGNVDEEMNQIENKNIFDQPFEETVLQDEINSDLNMFNIFDVTLSNDVRKSKRGNKRNAARDDRKEQLNLFDL